MSYKNHNKQKEKALIYYYKNREKRIEYAREYNKNNKEIKRAYDKKRRKLKNYNKIKSIQHYSKRVHFPKLLKKYNRCQICESKEKLEIHHIRYTKKISDCLLLCQSCHKKLHRKRVIPSFL